MSVEILSVALDDATIEKLAQRIVQLQGVTPPSQNSHSAQSAQVSGQGADPWTDDGDVPPQPEPQQQSGPNCKHGAMKYVAAGFSRSTNKSYPAFWGCPADRSAPDKCRGIPARS